ncbi:glycine--tRNA ligase subunit beta [Helicobacter bizzozeronii]|uniref:glycine--tRNA ligase subunit beta n=1 Tax=Helicobacter bizzozeronii TaxID=56877 RepID=UPI00227942D5|nr:glycine--tRNA ligase subunit beta [Helicobacter bizzozeronii]
MNPLLIEVLVEEMPAKALLAEFKHILDKFHQALQNHQVDFKGDLRSYYAPTRLVLHALDFPTHTPAQQIEHFGPPLSVAMSDHQLNPIGQKFYTKLGLDPAQAFSTALKNNKEVLHAVVQSAPIATATLLDGILLEFLRSLDFGKSMAWGSVPERFIRPIHNICVIFGDDLVPLEACQQAYGCTAKRATKIHVAKSFAYHDTPDIEAYFQTLQAGFVILDPNKRQEKILHEIKILEQEHGVQVQIDLELLEEVVAITTYPTALYGLFDRAFLDLPTEVITTSMKEHQRYFATFKEDTLNNGFIVVSNAPLQHPQDFATILAGNQKVLRARLSDAVFFYQNDLKKSIEWEHVAPALDKIAFMQGLGSLEDKVGREQKIALFLAQKYAPNTQAQLLESLHLAKADLLSEVVYEFPELQGVMGSYYAKHHHKSLEICTALKEQYHPIAEGAPLPSTFLGALLALSIKLDSLLALFSVGKIPTGSKDPFALRRACNGVLRICLHYNLPFNLQADLQTLSKLYVPFDLSLLREFMLERLSHVLNAKSPNLYKSVLKGIEALGGQDYEICQMANKLYALQDFLDQVEDSKQLVSVFKRVANITQDTQHASNPDPCLFQDTSEQGLYEAYLNLQKSTFPQWGDKIHALFALKAPLELFFEKVLINDSNPQIQNNRKSLLFLICREFLSVADIKEL